MLRIIINSLLCISSSRNRMSRLRTSNPDKRDINEIVQKLGHIREEPTGDGEEHSNAHDMYVLYFQHVFISFPINFIRLLCSLPYESLNIFRLLCSFPYESLNFIRLLCSLPSESLNIFFIFQNLCVISVIYTREYN